MSSLAEKLAVNGIAPEAAFPDHTVRVAPIPAKNIHPICP